MFRAHAEHTGRSPKLDAPPYDPSLWEGKDCAFITTLRDVYYRQERMERQLRMETSVVGGAALPVPAASHTQLATRPSSWWGKLLDSLFPRYYAQQALANLGFGQMSNDELVNRMHFALQAGDTDISALIAKELARRRACLYEEDTVTRSTGRNTLPTGVSTGTESRIRTKLTGGFGGRVSSGTAPHSGTRPSTDSSFVVPEVLFQTRPRGGDSGENVLRF
ncbi:uncharacterized protein Tco025E_00236 [Trypanosoma conorhini]|uniref:Uncharacterized protein n=1 Tax=Trypanosoma conorhini TaxID=83891 RepID=A0A3R7M6H5_9TRYP|nr:uncharacterized protein Tco025E_00236 [Trypanosoma conorhini]RNF27500.1 hypothetical protein Tco025E_00236 [Trypanosoma conorhini]